MNNIKQQLAQLELEITCNKAALHRQILLIQQEPIELTPQVQSAIMVGSFLCGFFLAHNRKIFKKLPAFTKEIYKGIGLITSLLP